MIEQYSIVCMCVCVYIISLSVHPLKDTCFPILFTINNAAMNMGVHTSSLVFVFVSFVHSFRNGIAGLKIILFSIFVAPPCCFCSGCTNLRFLPTGHRGSIQSAPTLALVISCLLMIVILTGIRCITHYGSNLHFPKDQQILALVHVPVGMLRNYCKVIFE